ncbi:MAG: CotH kinase family protein [Saprospirales bacterium]|nr:CotH kinase family protein [Saprospirales bacterium]
MKTQLLRLLLPVLLLPAFLPAQDPFPALPPVFKDDVIPRIDILLPPDSLDILLAPGNEESNYHWHGTFIFDNGDQVDTVDNIGFRLRGNTSRYAAKKSFKVSFNTYEPGRKWEGLEKLNLNGEHNDPAVIRSKICWDLLRWIDVPAPRSNHVELYINGDFYGLYINVEHIDEEFVQLRYGNNDGNLYKCLYPADLVYKGNNPDLYKEEFWGRRAYELITNTDLDDYSDLAHFIDVLNNTPLANLPCELEQVFEVDTYLKAIAFDVLSGNWDGSIFNKNNFYLYHNLATGKFEYIPYDLDNTLGIDWLGKDWITRNIYDWGPSNEARPIYDRILAVPEYRDRYSYYTNQILALFFVESTLFPYIEHIKTMIGPSAEADPYRPLDYGFTFSDFLNSYENALPFFHTPTGLKPYITGRRNTALQQLDLNAIPPIITGVKNNYPNLLQDISVSARFEDDGAVITRELCYQIDGQNLTCVEMVDDGQHADGGSGDGISGAIIPAVNQPVFFEYYVRAVDNSGKESHQPVCGFTSLAIGNAPVPLVINEFMASNTGTFADEAGEYDDWLEIFSLSDVQIYLGNYYLSDDPAVPDKWPMPEIWIQPGQYLIFWADGEIAQSIYHTNFKLDAGGEYVGIYSDAAGNYALIDGVGFGAQETDAALGRLPNGTGPIQPVFPTPGAENQPLTGVEYISTQSISLAIYPNPSSGTIRVEWKKTLLPEATIQVQNVWGEILFTRKDIQDQGTTLNLENLPAGIYFIQVVAENGVRGTGRIIKE